MEKVWETMGMVLRTIGHVDLKNGVLMWSTRRNETKEMATIEGGIQPFAAYGREVKHGRINLKVAATR